MIFRGQRSIRLQLLAHRNVQLAPRSIVRRNDQRAFGRFDVAPGNFADAFAGVGDFPNSSLFVKRIKRGGDIALCERFHGGFECRIFLPHNFIEVRSAHSCLLQLLEGAASFDALMLPCVADQKHAVLRPEPAKEIAHLVRACQARLVHKIEMLLFGCLAVGPASQETLQRPVSTPASASCRAAREVGASPSTVYP